MAFNVRTVGDIINYTFPFLGDRLWYITCYFFVFLIAPVLNVIGSKVSKTGYRKLLIVLGVLMSVITTFCIKDFFHVVNKGYSAGWLIYMYLLGGYFKLHGFGDKPSKGKVLIGLIISLLAIIGSKYLIDLLQTKVNLGTDRSWYLYYYSSPLTLFNSMCIFYLFATGNWTNIRLGKVITWLSTVSLGVYLIHAHPYSLDHILIGKNLSWAVKDNPLYTLMIITGSIIGIYIGLGFLEWLRIKTFKICGIDRLTKKIGERFDRVLSIESNA